MAGEAAESEWWRRLLKIRRGEGVALLLSAGYFFFVLFGCFLLRPVRETMGATGGLWRLQWLFIVTCIVSLFAALAFGGLVSRAPKRLLVPIAVRVVNACLLGFAATVAFSPQAIGETSGYVFYVWFSVANLFLTSLFWSVMADTWRLGEGKRLFPAIGVGGTLGALLGGIAATRVAVLFQDMNQRSADAGGTVSNTMLAGVVLMLLAVAAFEAAVRCCVALRSVRNRDVLDAEHGPHPTPHRTPVRTPARTPAQTPVRIGGTAWAGAARVARSPYLFGTGAYVVLMALSTTLIYFVKAEFVIENESVWADRLQRFAELDAVAQGLTLLTQLFLTSRLIERIGIGRTLMILPVLTVAGFGVLAVWPVFGVLAAFQGVHRAARYAIARPARETLFAVVPVEDRYKAKSFIDLFLYRGGDAAGTGVSAALTALAAGLIGTLGAVVPLVAGWAALSVWLGRSQSRRATQTLSATDAAPTGRTPPEGDPP